VKVNKKTVLIITLACFIIMAFSGISLGTDGAKNIKVYYKGIKLKINGAIKNTAQEPFMFNNRTYVPLRYISEVLEADVKWDNSTKTIGIQYNRTDPDELTRLQNQLYARENEIVSLEIQLQALEEELDNKNKLKDLEDDLNKDYDELEDVKIDEIEIQGDSDDIEVLIEVDLSYRDNETKWSDLNNDDIEDYIENIVEDIRDELSEDTEIKGEIVNTDDNDEEIIEFEKDGEDDLEIDFNDEDYRDIKDKISDVEDSIRNDEFYIENYKFKIDYIDYDIDDDEIEVDVYDVSGDLIDEDDWEDIDSDDIEHDVEDICEDIVDEFKDDVGVDPERVYIRIFDENWHELDDFEYDVDDEKLEN
jgi:hypothetical protein